jgi:hypothetical protein
MEQIAEGGRNHGHDNPDAPDGGAGDDHRRVPEQHRNRQGRTGSQTRERDAQRQLRGEQLSREVRSARDFAYEDGAQPRARHQQVRGSQRCGGCPLPVLQRTEASNDVSRCEQPDRVQREELRSDECTAKHRVPRPAAACLRAARVVSWLRHAPVPS